MPPDSPNEDVLHLPSAQDYPSLSSNPSPHATSPVPPPPKSTWSSLVFISPASRVTRVSSIHNNHSKLSLPSGLHESDGSTKSSSFDSVSSLRSSSGSSQLSIWWPSGYGASGSGGGDAWKRSREYQTRLTAGECFEHAFSNSKKAREWEMARRTTCNALASLRSSSEVPLWPESQLSPPVTANLCRRSGFFLGSELEQRTKGCYIPPPKGSFKSSPRLNDRNRRPAFSSASSPSSSMSSVPSSLIALSTLYSTKSGMSVAVREPLLSRVEWEKASARRTQRRKFRKRSLPCTDTTRSVDPVDASLYAGVEPISISSQYIGGWTGLELAFTKRIRQHPSLNRRNSSSQARHPFEDLRPRPPKSPHSEDEHQESLHCVPTTPVADGADTIDEENLTVDKDNENMTLTLWSEIFSQLASSFSGLEMKSRPLSGS